MAVDHQGLNLVAGQWIAGISEIENRNPSDLSDLVAVFAQASSEQLQTTLEQAQIAQRQWAACGIERKYQVLMTVGNELKTAYIASGEPA